MTSYKNMKILYSLAILAMATLPACASQTLKPSSNIVTKTVSISSFDEIDVSRANVIVRIGTPDGTAKISAPDNIIDKLNIECRKGELTIGYPSKYNINGNVRTTVEVTAASLSELDASLSSKVEVRGVIDTTDKLDLQAGTSATILLGKVSAAKCDIESTTSGTVSIQQLTTSGKTEISVTTSADAKIGNLSCRMLEATATTSGDIELKGGKTDRAEYTANTSGSINASALTATTGEAFANTSGSIRCNIKNPTGLTSNTGGSIKN